MKNLILCISVLSALVACSSHESNKTGSLSGNEHKGRRYYLRECGRCHQHYQPNNYSASQWQTILARKRNKVSLTNSQFAELADFLKSQAEIPASSK